MGEKYKYAAVVLALFAGFALFCTGWYLARTTAPSPYHVSVQRLPEEENRAEAPAEENPWPDSLLPGEVIDINTAGVYDLQRLPGIGEKRALEIIAWREERGPFQSVDQLDEVSGIGPGIIEGLRAYASAG